MNHFYLTSNIIGIVLFFNTTFCYSQSLSIVKSIVSDTTSFYYTDFSKYPVHYKNLPVGVFDSGTGGLSVLNAIVTMDFYNNKTHKKGADGKVDFATEDFIYLADQANMPYGNYASMNKTDLLQELIVKDAQFLMSNKYYNNGQMFSNKKPVKVIVVACNTATAHGLSDVQQFLAQSKTKVEVIGVINAGVIGALKTFNKNENGSIGIFATAGTVASNGYTIALKKMIADNKYTGDIQIYSQGGVGIAEAIDEDLNYIDKKSTTVRDLYKGPSLSSLNLNIDKTLMEIYGFDFTDYKMLCDSKIADQCSIMQINSSENYVRFHLVSLLERMKNTPNVLPLKTIVLGCTHYPFLTKEITAVLRELRKIKKNGKYLYKKLLAKNIVLIDPSVNTAQELYEYLVAQNLFDDTAKSTNVDFFISIPNTSQPDVVTEGNGQRFTYDYKYGRNTGENKQFTLTVPFSKINIPAEISTRFQKQIPRVFDLIISSKLNEIVEPSNRL